MIIECPGCNKSLNVKAPKDASSFACPNCNTTLRIKVPARDASPSSAPRPVSSSSRPQPRGQSPVQAPVQPTQPSLAAAPGTRRENVSTLPPSFSNQSHRARPPKNTKWLLIGGILGAVTLIAAVAGIALIFLLDIGTGAITKLNPLADTPTAITHDYIKLADEFISVVDSVKDADSATGAVSKLEELDNRCRDIEARAIALGPLTDEQWNAVGKVSQKKIPEKKEEVKASLDRLKDRGVKSEELSAAFVNFQFATMQLTSTMETAWQQIPEPEDELQKIERERIQVYRELWQAIARQHDDVDQAKLASEYENASEKIADLARQKRDLGNVERFEKLTGSPYTHIETDFVFAVAAALSNCLSEKTQQSESLKTAVQKLADADYDYGGAGSKYDSQRTAEDVEANRIAENAARREQFEKSKQRFAPPTKNTSEQTAGSKKPPGPDQPIDNQSKSGDNVPAGAAKTTGDAANDAFIAKQGAGNVVLINVANTKGRDPKIFALPLRTSVGSRIMRWSPAADSIAFAMRYDGDISKVADAIDWGKIQSTDHATRTIEVIADDP